MRTIVVNWLYVVLAKNALSNKNFLLHWVEKMAIQNKVLSVAGVISLGLAGFYFDKACEYSAIKSLTHPSNPKVEITGQVIPNNIASSQYLPTHDSHNKSNEINNDRRLNTSANLAKQLNTIVDTNAEDKYKTSALVGELLTKWARLDPVAAIEWLSLIDDSSDIVDGYYYRVLQIYMEKDFYTAGSVIAGLTDSGRKQRLVYNYVSTFARVDAEEALFWSDTALEGEIRQIAKHQILNTLAYSKPDKVLDLLAHELVTNIDTSLDSSKEMALIASSQLDSNDFKYERNSLYQYPEEFRPQIAYGVASNWDKSDLESAHSWIQSLPPGEAKKQALRGYNSAISK